MGGEEKEEKEERKGLGQGKVRHSYYLEQDGPRLELGEQSLIETRIRLSKDRTYTDNSAFC